MAAPPIESRIAIMTIAPLSRQKRRAAEKLKRGGRLPYPGATAAIAAELQRGLDLHRAGRLGDAETAYRRVLAAEEDHPHALNLLGVMFCEDGRPGLGLGLLRQAIAVNANIAEYHTNLSEAALQCGHLEEALAAAKQGLKVNRQFVRAHLALGTALMRLGQGDAAMDAFRTALKLFPEDEDAQVAFGSCVSIYGITTLDEPVEQLLVRALKEGWARPSKLAQGIVPALKAQPEMRAFIDAVTMGGTGERLCAMLLDGTIPQHLRRPLVREMLGIGLVADPDFENLFIRLRATYLRAVAGGTAINGDGLDGLVALAQFAFAGDFALAESDEESRTVDGLLGLLARGDHRPELIAAVAAYRRLVDLEPALEDAVLDGPLEPIARAQLREVEADRRRHAMIARRTPIAPGTSEEVRSQYEESPYPRWTHPKLRPSRLPLRVNLRQRFGDVDLPQSKRILIAGCGTGQEAIELAQRCRSTGEQILAIDLSLASLAYATRQTERLGLTNISYAQADITLIDQLAERFGIITSNGVLHHLADPVAGWRNLTVLLEPKGLMQISLYSRHGRRAIVAAQSLVAERGWRPDPRGIREARRVILALPIDHPARDVVLLSDFYSLNMCRDLLFHVQEHRFTLPELAGIIDQLGLRFLGFDVPGHVSTRYRMRFPGDAAMADLSNWNTFEEENPKTFVGMYQFWVTSIR